MANNSYNSKSFNRSMKMLLHHIAKMSVGGLYVSITSRKAIKQQFVLTNIYF